MAYLNIFLFCVMMIFLTVDKSNAAISSATCGNTDTCSILPNAECTGSSGSETCGCKTGTSAVNNVCVLPLEGDCSGDLVCNTENAECTNQQCSCKSDYKPTTDKSACEQKALGDTCSAVTDCQHVENVACTNNVCSCPDGYNQDGNGDCKIVFGSTCTGTNACPGLSNSICSGETCQCIPNYVEVENVCDLALTEIDCTVEGNECPTNAMCNKNKKCECDVDFVVENNQCSESGAASTKAMILMMFTVFLIRLVDKLLM